MKIIYQSVRVHTKSMIPCKEQVCWLALPDDGSSIGPVAFAHVVRQYDNSMVLQHLMVCDEVRKCGLGMMVLEFLHQKYGTLNAIWLTKAGCALARKFDAKHGAQKWQIGATRLPPELEALVSAHAADTDLEYAQ